MNRRDFIERGGRTSFLTAVMATSFGMAAENREFCNNFVHHVFFWLKEPNNKEHHEIFQNALEKLVTIESIQSYHLGKPADTNREVIDSSYQYSLLTIFEEKAAHDSYQVDAVHDEFRKVASDLCSKVVVYDSVDI